jgi:hypothetical protein
VVAAVVVADLEGCLPFDLSASAGAVSENEAGRRKRRPYKRENLTYS